DELLVRELENEKRSPAARALALATLSPDQKFLSLGRLRDYLRADYRPLRLEAVRTLGQQRDKKRFELLAVAARDDQQSDEVRAEAISGLAPAAEQYKDLLEQLAGGANRTLGKEAERVLRRTKLRSVPDEAKPPASDLSAWHTLLNEPGDPA